MKRRKTFLRILSDDPGSKNYGRSVVLVSKGKKDRLRFKVKDVYLAEGMIQKLMGNVEDTIMDYMGTICQFEAEFGPFDLYCAERFMSRGRFGGNLGELVSSMLTVNVIALECKVKTLIAAVTWKGPFKKLWDLDQLYKMIRPAEPHVLDATLIGIYAAHIHLGLKPFEKLTERDLEKIMIKIQAKYAKIKAER